MENVYILRNLKWNFINLINKKLIFSFIIAKIASIRSMVSWIKKKVPNLFGTFAVWTGLEPATPCVTGRYSNQLNYHTVFNALVLDCGCKGKCYFLICKCF